MGESAQNHWWREFFDSALWIDVQKGTWSDEASKSDAAGVETLLRLSSRSKVLDVPCGDGRVSVELAARGHDLVGVDLSRSILEEAAKKATVRGVSVRWECRDMRTIPRSAEFDGAFCLWGSLGYFDESENREFLRSMAGALRPGGRFLIDTHSLETLLPRFEARERRQVGEILVLEERSFDVLRSRVEVEWSLVRGGRTEKLHSSIRLYSYRELCGLMEEVGFRDFQGYGNLNGEPFDVGSPRLILTASRS